VDAFLVNAERILQTAAAAENAGPASREDWTILVSPDGGLRMIAGSDWNLDALAAHHGAQAAYRTGAGGGRVRVEGRSRGRRCLLETAPPGAFLREMLPDRPRYLLPGE
jgi:hypothetical protein